MKVWLIQDILAPYRIKLFEKISQSSGVEFRLILLSKGLRSRPAWQYDNELLPFTCERISGWSLYLSYEYPINITPKYFFRLLNENPDVVICAGYSLGTLLTFLFTAIKKKKYLIWMEGTKFTEQGRRSFIRLMLRRFLTRHAAALIDAGTESRSYLRSLLPANSHVPFFTAFNAVDNAFIFSETHRYRDNPNSLAKFRRRFASKNILFVGQMIERKGVSQLIEAYKVVLAKLSEPVGLIMLGFGPLTDMLKATRTSDRLEHLFLEGFVEQDIYPKYLAIADVMVLPSLQDPNPLVVFEALAAGLPMVLSERAGNAADFIETGKNGYVIDPEDTEEMADKILAILQASPEEKQAMSAASLSIVKKANYDNSARAFVDAARFAIGRNG